jgi:hypothetical protein
MSLVGAVLIVCSSGPFLVPLVEAADAAPVGRDADLLPYRFEGRDLGFCDIVTLNDGPKRLGKVMEWADQVLLYTGEGQPSTFDAAEVKQFQFRREERHRVVLQTPDLTVAYVERLPRDPSWHGHVLDEGGLARPDLRPEEVAWHPKVGDQVTFRAHVLNAGGATSAAVRCRVRVDGAEVHTGEIPALDAGREFLVEFQWSWQDGPHALRVEIDPESAGTERARWNDTFVEPVQALAVAVVVAKDRYEAFQKRRNAVDSFCFEDWVQHQIHVMNGLFAASVYPSAPQGVKERLRVDRILVVDDPDDEPQRRRWQAALRRDGRPDGLAEYQAVLVWGKIKEDENLDFAALRVDWRCLQDLGRQLGLVDPRKTDTTIEQCLVLDGRGRYLQCRHLFPYPATLMYTAGAFRLCEQSAAALNELIGRPRGFTGSYLYQLPAGIAVDVFSNTDAPLAGVTVEVYQLMSEGEYAHAISGYGRGDPLYSGQTDASGRFVLLDQQTPSHKTPQGFELRPNPFGMIASDGSNGLLLVRLRQDKAEEYYFLSLYEANVAYYRGQRDLYVRPLHTRFGAPDAPPPPPFTAILMPVRDQKMPAATFCWTLPDTVFITAVEEFRIYERTGFADYQVKPWTLLSTLRPSQTGPLCAPGAYFDELRYDGPYSLDTFYAVSIVDHQGRESSLAPPACLAYDKDSVGFAIDTNNGYITLAGEGQAQMMVWDGSVGTQQYGVRTRAFAGYQPNFAGAAVGKDGRLIVADPVNHVLAFYDRGDLAEVVPQRRWWPGFPSDDAGEFYEPTDVAVDEAGRIFVADRNNDRVQILDSRGRFQALLEAETQLHGPHALGYANGVLCVTDQAGTRCRVYDMQSPTPRYVRELPPLVEADRALVSKSGKIYVAGRVSVGGTTGILVFVPQAGGAVLDHVEAQDIMGGFHRPRGLYVYPRGGADQFAYFVNQFPFDVRRCKLQ